MVELNPWPCAGCCHAYTIVVRWYKTLSFACAYRFILIPHDVNFVFGLAQGPVILHGNCLAVDPRFLSHGGWGLRIKPKDLSNWWTGAWSECTFRRISTTQTCVRRCTLNPDCLFKTRHCSPYVPSDLTRHNKDDSHLHPALQVTMILYLLEDSC